MPSLGGMVHHDREGMLIRKARLYDALVGMITLGRDRRFREAILDLAGLEADESAAGRGP